MFSEIGPQRVRTSTGFLEKSMIVFIMKHLIGFKESKSLEDALEYLVSHILSPEEPIF
jgi:hypothetical protein